MEYGNGKSKQETVNDYIVCIQHNKSDKIILKKYGKEYKCTANTEHATIDHKTIILIL